MDSLKLTFPDYFHVLFVEIDVEIIAHNYHEEKCFILFICPTNLDKIIKVGLEDYPMRLSLELEDPYNYLALNGQNHQETYFSTLWSTGDTLPETYAYQEGIYWVMFYNDCDTIYDTVYVKYTGIVEMENSFFSQFGSQIRLLEDGELEVYNALGQKLLGTRARECTLDAPGLYILRFRSRDGVVRTAKIVR